MQWDHNSTIQLISSNGYRTPARKTSVEMRNMELERSHMDVVWHLLTILAPIATALSGWLLKAYMDLSTRMVKAETRIEERDKKFDATISELKTMYQDLSAKISTELGRLPRIEEKLDAMKSSIDNTVPRAEIELLRENIDQRFESLHTPH